MSWSAYFTGTPDKVAEALEKASENYLGQSKKEYDAALPHLVSIVKSNTDGKGGPIVQVQASGGAYIVDDEVKSSSCNVSIQPIAGALV